MRGRRSIEDQGVKSGLCARRQPKDGDHDADRSGVLGRLAARCAGWVCVCVCVFATRTQAEEEEKCQEMHHPGRLSFTAPK